MFAYWFLCKHKYSVQLRRYTGVGPLGYMVKCMFNFKELKKYFPKWLYHFGFSAEMYENHSFSASSIALSIDRDRFSVCFISFLVLFCFKIFLKVDGVIIVGFTEFSNDWLRMINIFSCAYFLPIYLCCWILFRSFAN